MPPLEEFEVYLKEIWDSKWLTNNGQFHRKLEEELAKYLNVEFISLFSNGTLALMSALQALNITGEVITTPFSFVATTHALWWNNIKPVFVDIEPETLNIDPAKIEAAITPRTTAILPVHVYGNPCMVDEIQRIADIYGLKILYDACHTFNTKLNGIPILNYGDLSVMSFHATKVFSTIEGGAIISRDEAMKKRIDLLKNFGFAGETTVIAHGINAKMNELQSAFGLLQLKYAGTYVEKRKKIYEHYCNLLKGVPGITVIKTNSNTENCYSYFAVLIDQKKFGIERDEVYNSLKERNIFTRRYFYPLISQFPAYSGLESAAPGRMPVAERVSSQVLCLPIYPDLQEAEVTNIVTLIKNMRPQTIVSMTS